MRVLIAEHAAKQIKKLDQPLKDRLKKAVIHISENPSIGKFLEDELKGLQSYRFSKYRIIY
ncbi:MAG: type II toxin-antitoxin system RelE/ParE family toxin [Nitrospirae bacterium]|nr:type II toxin-antitoxin system RelE/ParE family toxin [Nitrospirota bacterium]